MPAEASYFILVSYPLAILLRIMYLTPNSWFLAYIALTSVMSVFYVREYKIMMNNIMIQGATVVVFFWFHWTPKAMDISLYNLVVHAIFPLFIMVSGFVIVSAHYMSAINQLHAANEQLDATNKAKSDFLSMIGHEVALGVVLINNRFEHH